ncbi:MAG: thermonuclease family protein [Gammaproteobacteria bacterium]|nr:thermonuclease family protein [Gammaproteobacteria bacterium]
MFTVGLKKALRVGAFLFPRLRNRHIPAAVLFGSLLATAACAVSETEQIRHVIDGDTVVRADGRHVRLIGINTPETGQDGAPDQPLARAARTRLAQLVENKPVTLEFEQEREDQYGRLLARVRLADGSDAGENLLRAGLAWAIAVPPNLDRLAANLAAENEARAARRGVWNEPAYVPKPADRLTPRDTGFQLIEGRILRHGQGRHLMYFDLSPRLTLTVTRADWKKIFDGKPSEWVGRRVIARGWVTAKRDRDVAVAEPRTPTEDRLRLRVTHPAMLTWRD